MAQKPRQPYTGYSKWLENENMSDLQKQNKEAEAVFRRTGITFNVYGANGRIEADDPYYRKISKGWSSALKSAFKSMPNLIIKNN